MKRVALFLVLGTIAAVAVRTSAAIPEQVKIDMGLVAGTTATGQASVRAFKGIPFAAPPLGENRWRAPQPAARWDGVRNADAFGAPCTSGPAAARGGGGGARGARRRHAVRRGSASRGAGRARRAEGTGAERGLPVPQRLDQREERRRSSAGDGLDLWRRLHRRIRRPGRGTTARTWPPRVRSS